MSRLSVIPSGILLLAFAAGTASAQFYGGGSPAIGGTPAVGNPCACQQTVAVNPCMQQVQIPQYRQVASIEYQQQERTVQRPVVETKYVEQPVTQYVPVTEQRTVEVPTVSYQNVTECQTVQRDLGQWQTTYQRVNKMTPCEYDRRPNMLGWWNRTAYSFRQSFKPNVVTRRHYVPNMVVQSVPVTRQVAVRGTRQVTYNVTRMVAQTTTRKVAVNTVKYVAEKQMVSVPVTVMKTVPTGVATAWVPIGSTGTATALAPTPDTIGRRADAGRTADSTSSDSDVKPFRRSSVDDDGFDTSRIERRGTTPAATRVAPTFPQARRQAAPAPDAVVASAGQWVSRSTRRTARPVTGPALIGPAVAAAR